LGRGNEKMTEQLSNCCKAQVSVDSSEQVSVDKHEENCICYDCCPTVFVPAKEYDRLKRLDEDVKNKLNQLKEQYLVLKNCFGREGSLDAYAISVTISTLESLLK
jgi:hypothetical protein